MSLSYSQPRASRTRSWMIPALAVAALLAAGLVAAFAWPGAAPEVEAPAATGAGETPLAESSLPAEAAPALETVMPPAPAAVEPAPPAATLRVGDVSGAMGQPVEVPVRLEAVEELSSASIRLTYDPAVVSLGGVANGDVPQGSLAFHHDAATGTLVMLLTTSASGGATGDFTFATVTFAARDGSVGEVSPLDLTLRGAANPNGERMELNVLGGSFRNGVPGDVLGDGAVDQADYDQLAAYLVGEPVEIVRLNADLDGDGEITDADAVRLHQYLDGTRESP